MTDDHRERRLGEASNLQSAIDALGSVPTDHRKGFLHDRLMSAIDDICRQHSQGGKSAFTPHQMHAIKDISFQIVYILDPKSRGPTTFTSRLWHEFKCAGAIAQIGYVIATIAFVSTLVTGAVTITRDQIIPAGKFVWSYVTSEDSPGPERPKPSAGAPQQEMPAPNNAQSKPQPSRPNRNGN